MSSLLAEPSSHSSFNNPRSKTQINGFIQGTSWRFKELKAAFGFTSYLGICSPVRTITTLLLCHHVPLPELCWWQQSLRVQTPPASPPTHPTGTGGVGRRENQGLLTCGQGFWAFADPSPPPEWLLLSASLLQDNSTSCPALMILHFSSLCRDVTAFAV